jgi:antitoxin Xre/MbcA/ParS-like protein
MSEEMPQTQPAEPAGAPIARSFRKYAPPSSLTPDQCRRQTGVLRAACEHLAPRGTAIAFLNSDNQKLGGKPLQLALDSEDGLLRVERLLASMNARTRT